MKNPVNSRVFLFYPHLKGNEIINKENTGLGVTFIPMTFDKFPCLIILLIFGFPGFLVAQLEAGYLPKFRHFGIDQGLSTSAVTSIAQDREGKIWIGTHDGLNCAYGTYFKKFYQAPGGLPQSAISDLLCDKSGDLWILTYGGGLGLLDPVNQKFKSLPKGLINDWLQGNCLAEDRQGNIWMGYYEGLQIFNSKTGKAYKTKVLQGCTDPIQVSQIAFDQNGLAWIATPFQGIFVCKLSDRIQTLAHLPFSDFHLPSQGLGFFHRIYPKGKGIIASTQKGLFTYQFTKGKIEYQHVPLSKKVEPKAWLIDKSGNSWIGTNEGEILVLDKNGKPQQAHFPYWGHYNAGGVTEMITDQMGGIWVGGEAGLAYTHPQLGKFKSYSYSPEIQNDIFKIVWAIFTKDDENFLIGSQKGLFRFNRNSFENAPLVDEKQLSIGPVYTLVSCEKDRVLAGTRQGLLELQFHHGEWITRKIFPEIRGVIGSILKLENGDILAGSYDERGLYRIQNPGGKANLLNLTHEQGNAQSLCNNSINIISKTFDNQIFIGTDKGFCYFNSNTNQFDNSLWHVLRKKEPGISPLIYGMAETKDELWLGTFGSGIFIYNRKNKTWQQLSRKDGLLNESVYCMAIQGKYLWASTNQGMAKIDTETKEVQTFTQGDGLQSNEFNHFAIFQNPVSKRTYFGGIQGFDEISHFLKPGNNVAPKVILSSASILGPEKTIPLAMEDQPWQIEPEQRNIELEFAALNYLMPEKNQFSYRLKDNNNNLIPLGTKNKVTLINLEKGTYTLEVFGANNEGLWNPKPLLVTFEVLPFFYETWWFRGIIILGLFLGILAVAWLYFQARWKRQMLILERENAVREERNRISSEMHDDLGSGLTLIKMLCDLLLLKQKANAPEEIKKIALRSEALVDSLNTIVWALNDRNDDLKAMIGYFRQYAISLIENTRITLEFEAKIGDDVANYQIPGKIRRNIFLILKEGLQNIMKHSNGDKILIMITVEKARFEMVIHDNGSEKKTKNTSGGNGLRNMKNRATACGGWLEIDDLDGFTIRFVTMYYHESVIDKVN